MTYNPSIPQPTDTLSASQPQLLINFGQANTIMAIDHLNFTHSTVGDRGKHKKVTLTRQLVDYVADPSESIMYQKDNGGIACVYYSRTGAPSYLLIGKTYPTNAAAGCTHLPGGIVIQWGTANVPPGQSGDINFTQAFGSVYSIQCTFIRSSTSTVTSVYVRDGTVTNTRFRTQTAGTSGNHDIYWIAIGSEA